MKRTIRVAIIGCGDIAGGYDERKKSRGIFSHAGAYSSLPNVKIVSVFDINKKRLRDFSQRWSVKKSCKSPKELFEDRYDIISLCTPDHTHQTILQEIIKSSCTKYIWVEKPLTTTVKGARNVIKMAQNQGVGIWLSNQRRWEPAHIRIKKEIENGDIGQLVHVTGYYVKGITHIGCVMIDTLRFLFGKIKKVRAFPRSEVGSYGRDYSLSGALQFQNGLAATIIGCDRGRYVYSIFEIDIIGTKGRIKIEENGDKVSIYESKEYDYYSGFRELKLLERINTKMNWSMRYGLDLLLKDLASARHSTYSAEEGLKDLEAVEALRESAQKGGITVAL